jgi:hypothetical protein
MVAALIPITIANLGARGTLAASDFFPVQQAVADSLGTHTTLAAILAARGVAASASLLLGFSYSVATSGAPSAATLPAVSSGVPGNYLEIIDLDNNAGTNNITLTAAGSDLILDHTASGGTYVVRTSNTITRFTITSDLKWRAISYGA